MDGGCPRTGEDAVRAVVARLAADELRYVDVVLRSYRLDPWKADGDGGSDRPVGAGIPIDQLASWTPLVVGFIAQTVAGAAVESAAAAVGSRLSAWFARRRRRAVLAGALSAPVPAFDKAQRAYIRALAVRAAMACGRPVEEREAFAAAVVDALDDDAREASGPGGEG